MKRTVEVDSWQDRRSENPDLNRGMKGAEMRFVAEDDAGNRTMLAVQTNWYPEAERAGFHQRGQCEQLTPYARALLCVDADGGVLSPAVSGHDASALAPVIFESLIDGGIEKMWLDIESIHVNTFGARQAMASTEPSDARQAPQTPPAAPRPAPAAQDAQDSSHDTYTVKTPLGFEGRILIEVKG